METFVDFLQLLRSFGNFIHFFETYGNLLQLMLCQWQFKFLSIHNQHGRCNKSLESSLSTKVKVSKITFPLVNCSLTFNLSTSA